jgi:integrase
VTIPHLPTSSATAGHVPAADTVVLFDRTVNPENHLPMSVFADQWWDLTPGSFEAHTARRRINFGAAPDRFRHTAKHYVWQLINHDDPRPMGSIRRRRLALRSIALGFSRLTAFLHWLDTRDVAHLAEVTAEMLDDYAEDVARLEASANLRTALLLEVRRLWSYRSLLPASMRLPEAPPWDADDPSDLLGGAKRPRENRTMRIAADTMQTLLMWCLRFIDDFADDIITAFGEYLQLRSRSLSAAHRPGTRRSPRQAEAPLTVWLHQRERTGGALPSRPGSDGSPEIDWAHLCRLFDVNGFAFRPGQRLRVIVEAARLPLGGPAQLDTPITGLLHGTPWRPAPIRYDEAAGLARLLSTAALVVITYLSGMRIGEVLNLERGCVHRDPITQLWLITGKHFKNARDAHGNKIPEGAQRPDPWTTVAPAAAAITAVERLHPNQLLFTTRLKPTRVPQSPVVSGRRVVTRPSLGRTAGEINKDIADLITWINNYADQRDLATERIPPDPHGAITTARFRRTLAWHIVRRPRGLVAGAIQYGHLHVQMTLGYAGTYESGFPDDHTFEQWLFRLENLTENHRRLAAGEHVSGPAADTYRHRIAEGHQQFAGRVLTSSRHVRDLVSNPLLQIYPGRAITCVFDPAKALCHLLPAADDTRRTPDQDDCRPNCRNVAFTDRDIVDVRRQATNLRTAVEDRLAPSLRHHRERAELERLRTIIRRHDHGK